MAEEEGRLAGAARRLAIAVRRETSVARSGALGELTSAAANKREAFFEFRAIEGNLESCESEKKEAHSAIQDLLVAVNENANVLEAVKSTLDDASDRLHALLGGIADPGIYHRFHRPARHVAAARIDAKA
jgi:hypothetical protein